ncbi:hypothetical protein [uncultured Parolsenella sp.]|uniref:hypothetical protein n=1 Tax=uncultured Parolsenella sp. TaxID=2083008 RepID=UPI0025DBA8C1|nr:hypothetical protein [uncultured Parolsenella sp.]
MGKLQDACRRGDSAAIYRALRNDMARMLEQTESGRDYAAIAKSLIAVQEKVDETRPKRSKAQGGALASAQSRHLKVVDG